MEEYYVAYLDLLGSKKRIEDDDENNTDIWLKAIENIYRETLEQISTLEDNIRGMEARVSEITPEYQGRVRELIREMKASPIETKIFSDNIIFAIKVPNDARYKRYYIGRLYSIVSYFQTLSLCKYHWMLRGGITCGKLHVEKDYFIWGKSLIDAHALEGKSGSPPQIRVDDKFVRMHKDLFSNDYHKYNFINSPLSQNEEGIYFVGYETVILDQSNLFHNDGEQWLTYFQKTLSEMLKEHESDESIIQKVRWAIDYHNKVCTERNADDFKVEG